MTRPRRGRYALVSDGTNRTLGWVGRVPAPGQLEWSVDGRAAMSVPTGQPAIDRSAGLAITNLIEVVSQVEYPE